MKKKRKEKNRLKISHELKRVMIKNDDILKCSIQSSPIPPHLLVKEILYLSMADSFFLLNVVL